LFHVHRRAVHPFIRRPLLAELGLSAEEGLQPTAAVEAGEL